MDQHNKTKNLMIEYFYFAPKGRFLSYLNILFYCFIGILSFLVISAASLHAQDNNLTGSGLRWPIDETRIFTSTFAEHRPSRFHAGIDISTRGNTGFPCYAVADGSIIRMRANFNGYGKVLYLQLDDGRIATYAHLSRFTDILEDELMRLQDIAGWYEVEEFYEKGVFSFRQGDIIAYSGDTGAGPPHLHFEMRKNMHLVYDPVLDGFYTDDPLTPIISQLSLRPLDENSEIEGDILPVIRTPYHGRCRSVSFFGRVGVAIKAHDRQEGSWYKLGLRRIELRIDGILSHATHPDSFDYVDNHKARLEFDFELERDGRKGFSRLYSYGPNSLPFYDKNLNGGILDSKKLGAGDHLIEVIVFDYAGNTASASWSIKALSEPSLPPPATPKLLTKPDSASSFLNSESKEFDTRIIGKIIRVSIQGLPASVFSVKTYLESTNRTYLPTVKRNGSFLARLILPGDVEGMVNIITEAIYDSTVSVIGRQDLFVKSFSKNERRRWKSPDNIFEIEIEPQDLWFDLLAGMKVLPREENTITKVYSLVPGDFPFAKAFKLSFYNNSTVWDSQAVVVYRGIDSDGDWIYLGNNFDDTERTIWSHALSFEEFAVAIDTIPPTLTAPSLRDRAVVKKSRPTLSVKVKDELSGLNIRECSLTLDGKTVIWVYDPDKDTISYTPWHDLAKGEHIWEIKVQDNSGNSTLLKRTFNKT